MSKFLLNLLVQISKVLVYSKIKFYSEKNFPHHFRPTRPFSPVFFFTGRFSLPSPTGPRPPGRPSTPARPNRPPASSFHTDDRRARRCRRPASRRLHGRPDASTGRKDNGRINPHHFPITRRHFPSSITGNQRLQRRPLKLLQRRSLKALGLAFAL
jgi:hypothetical protein